MVTNALLMSLFLTAPFPASLQRPEQRLEMGVFFTYVFFEQIGTRDVGAGTSAAGLGGRIVWRLLRHLDVDGDLAVHPEAGVSGHRVQGFLGVRAGVRFSKVGLFAKMRPGFVYFAKDPFGVAVAGSTFLRPGWAHSVEPTLDLGGAFEYYTASGLVVRLDLADTIVSYNARSVVTSQFEPPRSVAGFTTHNRQWSLGVGRRF